MPITITSKKVNESSSCKLNFQLVDFDGTGISVSNIKTANMWIYNEYDGAVIRSTADVKSSFDASGNFSGVITSTENQIVNRDYNHNEFHICLFEIIVNSVDGDLTLMESIAIQIANIRNKT